jgi:hypothetical protein
MIRDAQPGSRILIFYPSRIPDPVIKWHQIPEPGSGAHRRLKLEELQNWQFLMKPQ